MEKYIQETAALLYLKRIPPSSREFVLTFAHLFPFVFTKVQWYKQPEAWRVLLVKEELG